MTRLPRISVVSEQAAIPPAGVVASQLSIMVLAFALSPRLAIADDDLVPSTHRAGATADWPQWRGPLGTGVAPDATPALRWSSTENVLWKRQIPGRGHSTPVVWGEQVFITAAVPHGPRMTPRMSGRPGAHDNLPVEQAHQFRLLSLDRATGNVNWSRTLSEAVPHEGGHHTASLASASPVTDGQDVYAYFGSYGLFCVDHQGTLVWQKRFGQMHTKHGHGEGSSPALADESIVVNWDHEEESFIVALDKKTGEPLWRHERDEVTSWSTPLIVDVDGRRQVIVCGTSRVRGYDLTTGREVWQCGGLSANIVATPVYADGVVYVGSSYDTRALMAIRLSGATGDVTGTEHVVWSRRRGTPYVPSPLLYDGALYFLTHYQNLLTRVDAKSGTDSPGTIRLGELRNIYASPVGAAGHVFVTDLQGTTLVMTNSDIPRAVAVNRVGEPVSASLAIAGNQIFIRGDNHLYCIADSADGTNR